MVAGGVVAGGDVAVLAPAAATVVGVTELEAPLDAGVFVEVRTGVVAGVVAPDVLCGGVPDPVEFAGAPVGVGLGAAVPEPVAGLRLGAPFVGAVVVEVALTGSKLDDEVVVDAAIADLAPLAA